MAADAATAPRTFHPFNNLPAELRRHIYLLATPARIVHLRETPSAVDSDEFDEFVERLNTLIPEKVLKLHPSLAYYAHNWTRHIPLSLFPPNGPGAYPMQPTLTDYGFTTNKTLPLPWEPTPTCPELPLFWLATRPVLAWQMTRQSTLMSQAPIPGLLHACAESRATLVADGYELAFGTRSDPRPRTWFNFRLDMLYMSSAGWELDQPHTSGMLDGGPWNIGQLLPADLVRVRRLALQSSAIVAAADAGYVAAAVRLVPNLDDLLLAGSILSWEADEWLDFERDRAARRAEEQQQPEDERRRIPTAAGKPRKPRDLMHMAVQRAASEMNALAKVSRDNRVPWGWVDFDIADCLGNDEYPFYTVGNTRDAYRHWWSLHSRENIYDVPRVFFPEIVQEMERRLAESMEDAVRSEKGLVGWKIPAVRIGHVGPRPLVELLHRQRDKWWWEQDMRDAHRAEVEAKEQERGVSPHQRIYRPWTRPRDAFERAYADDFEVVEEIWSWEYISY